MGATSDHAYMQYASQLATTFIQTAAASLLTSTLAVQSSENSVRTFM